MRATSASSWPSSPGLIPPGASPSSPFVHGTTTVRTPSSAYRARTPPVLDDSSSGCACTAISVSGALIPPACHACDSSGAPRRRALGADRLFRREDRSHVGGREEVGGRQRAGRHAHETVGRGLVPVHR